MKMTSKERFLAALKNHIPDRVPVTPDISCYIPCKKTGLPYWDILFFEAIPLWRAYLDAADYFGIDPWSAVHLTLPLKYADEPVEHKYKMRYDKQRDAMIRQTTIFTDIGNLSCEEVCFRNEPPTMVVKPIKNLERDWSIYKKTLRIPIGVGDESLLDEFRNECRKRCCAFGLGLAYPGFHIWSCFTQGGVEPLAFAQMDTPAILEEWFELDMAIGTRIMELTIQARPDYIFFGGSGTITLASPELAMKYTIPALKKWTAMAKAAGIPTLLHSCGKQRQLIEMLVEHTDMNCANPLEMPPMGDVDLAELKQTRGREIALMGNLHTTTTMLYGSPDDVRKAAITAMRYAGKGGGFILSTGDQCGRETPDENIFAMVAAAEKYGVYDQTTGELVNCPA